MKSTTLTSMPSSYVSKHDCKKGTRYNKGRDGRISGCKVPCSGSTPRRSMKSPYSCYKPKHRKRCSNSKKGHKRIYYKSVKKCLRPCSKKGWKHSMSPAKKFRCYKPSKR